MKAKKTRETRFIPENEGSNAGMDSVGSDQKVALHSRSITQMHIYALALLLNGLNACAETELNAVLNPRIENTLEISAHEIEMAIVKKSLTKALVRQRKALFAGVIEEHEPCHRVVNSSKVRQQTELLGS